MDKKLDIVLQHISSRLLSKLWSFYRDYFEDDTSCLTFIYETLRNGPKCGENIWDTEEGETNEKAVIPCRMLNCVERMVSAARDMEQIRRGKDIFKIVYLVTCIETLQKLSGKNCKKKAMLFDFFENYTSETDKECIRENFECIEDEDSNQEDSFWQFISVLNEYRNCATHEGEYWDFCFNNDYEQTPLLLNTVAQLKDNAPRREYAFETKLSYKQFETIFVKSCIKFIKNYIGN